MKQGLTKQEIEDLQAQIPRKDPIAQRASLETLVGSKEAIEEALFPWLKARRRRQRRPAEN